MRMFRSLLLAGTAAVALAGCANPNPFSVGRPVTLPDGHSTAALASGSICTTDCWHEVTVAGVVHSHYKNGQYVSDLQDFHAVTAPAPGLDLANMVVPSVIEGGATLGAGVMVRQGLEQAGAWEAEGTAASGKYVGQGIASSGKAVGQGYASAKPPVITNINTNTFANSNTLSNTNMLSAVSSSRSSASATARAQQSQGQTQIQGLFLNNGLQ